MAIVDAIRVCPCELAIILGFFFGLDNKIQKYRRTERDRQSEEREECRHISIIYKSSSRPTAHSQTQQSIRIWFVIKTLKFHDRAIPKFFVIPFIYQQILPYYVVNQLIFCWWNSFWNREWSIVGGTFLSIWTDKTAVFRDDKIRIQKDALHFILSAVANCGHKMKSHAEWQQLCVCVFLHACRLVMQLLIDCSSSEGDAMWRDTHTLVNMCIWQALYPCKIG